VLWAFGFMMDQFIEPNRTSVITALSAHGTETLRNVDRFVALEHHQNARAPIDIAVGMQSGNSSSTEERRRRIRLHADEMAQRMPSARQQTMDTVNNTIATIRDNTREDRSQWAVTPNGAKIVPRGAPTAARYDFNYVRFEYRPSELAGKLASDMRADNSGHGRALSKDQVLAELRKLEKVEMRSRPYVQNAQYGAPGADGAYPARIDHTAGERAFSAVRFDERSTAVFVFSGLLFCERREPFEAVVEACTDRYTPRATYLAGTQHKPTTPHLFGVYAVGPRPDNRMRFCMPSSVKNRFATVLFADERLALRAADATHADAPPWMRSESFVITEPIDEFATRYRLHAISLPHNSAALTMRYSPRATDQLVRQRGTIYCQLSEPANTWRYPTDAEVTLPAHQRDEQLMRATRDKADEELYRNHALARRVTRRADIRAPEERARIMEFGNDMYRALYDVASRDVDEQELVRHAAEQAAKRARVEAAAAKPVEPAAPAAPFAVDDAVDDDADESHERRLADLADLDDLDEPTDAAAERAAAEQREAEAREREFGAASETVSNAERPYDGDDMSYYMSALE